MRVIRRYQPRSSVVMPLIVANIVMFFLQLTFKWVTPSFVLIWSNLLTRPWIAVTHMFLHGGFAHIFYNMWALWMFGPILEQRIGRDRFLILYFGSGIGAAILSGWAYPSALGASGAIMGLLGALIILMPNLQVLFFYFIPMPLYMAGIVWAALDIFGFFYPSGVANLGHLAGMGIGIAYALTLREKKKSFHRTFKDKTHLTAEDLEDYLRSGRI